MEGRLTRSGRGARRRRAGTTGAVVAALAAGTLALGAPAAQADSGWRCRDIQNGTICLRTFTRDQHHISGADIMYTKYAGGCITLRFWHRIRNWNGSERGRWGDNGKFSMCQSQSRSFFWSHGGAGAYVPDAGTIQGFLVVDGQGTIWGPSIDKQYM